MVSFGRGEARCCLAEVECCNVWSGLDEVGYHQELFSISKVRVW